jgi:hypothetical protein
MSTKKFSQFLIIFLLLGALACEDNDCPEGIDDDYSLSYSMYGGFAGASWELHIAHDGYLEVHNTFFGLGDEIESLVVADSLTSMQKAEWGQRIEDVGFNCLEENYPPINIVMDGFSHDLMVTTRGETKAVHIDANSNAPKSLEQLVWDLYYDIIHPVYHDSSTTGILFVRTIYNLLPWPFSDVVATGGAGRHILSDIDITGEITRFLNDLYYPGGVYQWSTSYCFIDDYRIYTIGYSRGDYFTFHNRDSLHNWPENISFALADIEAGGMAMEGDLYQQVRSVIGTLPNIRTNFIDSEILADSLVYSIVLWPGVPIAVQ